MLNFLPMATVITLILAIVLAVACDAPLVRVLLPMDDGLDFNARLAFCSVGVVLILAGLVYESRWYGPWLLGAGWLVALVYWWWSIARQVRGRR